MRYDPFRWLVGFEPRHPRLARFLAMRILGFVSPFNSHLGAEMLEWTDRRCAISLRRRRKVRNHVGSIHAGALFTLGETCAGLVIVRNFPFQRFRPLMSEVRITYSKQARGDVTGTAEMPAEEVDRMLAVIGQGEIPFTELVTHITNRDGEIVAEVTTLWQVKSWDLVGKR